MEFILGVLILLIQSFIIIQFILMVKPLLGVIFSFGIIIISLFFWNMYKMKCKFLLSFLIILIYFVIYLQKDTIESLSNNPVNIEEILENKLMNDNLITLVNLPPYKMDFKRSVQIMHRKKSTDIKGRDNSHSTFLVIHPILLKEDDEEISFFASDANYYIPNVWLKEGIQPSLGLVEKKEIEHEKALDEFRKKYLVSISPNVIFLRVYKSFDDYKENKITLFIFLFSCSIGTWIISFIILKFTDKDSN
ncbi:MAG: hypothetical protein SFU98_09395 [Leptospiraceae bacterium]|nr:hypothetical protein [Leptospiraceae bacterium]